MHPRWSKVQGYAYRDDLIDVSMSKRRIIDRIDRLFGIGGTDPDDIAMIEERIAALQPRMAWLYLLIAMYFVGLAFVMRGTESSFGAEAPLGLLIAIRLSYWFRRRDYPFRGEEARAALRGIGLGSVAVAAGYLWWLAAVSTSVQGVNFQLLMLSGSICAVASGQTVATLPRAARAALIMLGLPASIAAMIFGTNAIASVVGFNLLLCTCISLNMVALQDVAFVRGFGSRLDGERERHRAGRAEKRALEERRQARAAAESDFLTGLPNRRAFLTAIARRVATGRPDTLMILDLDGFKPVNDTFGHTIGDELLKSVACRLVNLTHGDTLVARLGGDEFAILARGVDGDSALRFAEEVIHELGQPYRIGSSTVGIAACLGMAVLDAGSSDPSDAIRQADLALYRAKAAGRGKIKQYSRGLGEAVKRRSAIELALREPGVEHEIELAFQPIYDLETMRIASFEALARWSHSTLGPVSPADFIPITEQIQLVEHLSGVLLARAIDHAACWPGRQRLSFNLSAVQLCSIGSATRVLDIVAAADFPPHQLQIEVTETAMMGDLVAARCNLQQLRAAGVKVVLDDFGAGFASIGYLREMQFDKLKLDGSLLAACESSEGTALLKGVISLARAIGTPCIAEHVETMQQVILLRILGCRYGQGFWLGKPVTAIAAETLSRAELLQGPDLRLAG